MKIGRKVTGKLYQRFTKPQLRQSVVVYVYTSSEVTGPYRTQLIFESGNDWAQSVELTARGVEQLRDNLVVALTVLEDNALSQENE